MPNIADATIAILATDGFEEAELTEPKRQLTEAGAKVVVIAPKAGSIKSWDETDWGSDFTVDKTLDNVSASEFDALVLPGGQINPDTLRADEKAVTFIRTFASTGKPLAAICHAPWLLIEADLVKGRTVTSFPSIKTDVQNAGGLWQDGEVVTDGPIITSRKPDDLDGFCAKIIEFVERKQPFNSAA